MSTTNEIVSWMVWRFIRGDITANEFMVWALADLDRASVFGQPLFTVLLSADYSDRNAIADLKRQLFDWTMTSGPRDCPYLDHAHKYAIDYYDLIWGELGNGHVRRLLPIGYWSELRLPQEFVDTEWDPAERDQLIDYVDRAYVICGWLGFSWCRMGCPPTLPTDIGTRDLTDGTWIFPEGLVHYIRHHAVKPDVAFMWHVRESGYRLPTLDLPRNDPRRFE